MKVTRSLRWLLAALLLSVLSASAYAGVFISVGFAPPPLPVYDQPPCPEPGLMWTPGYWAYGDDGYYWVPGTWVPAPQPGYLWTPPYWGWDNGLYVFHAGSWGPHVGYYGGVNYGYGYGGIGFVGGEWRGGHFAYNTAVMHIGFHGGLTFMDRARVDRGFVSRDSRVAFSGGPGGIHYQPRPEERMAERERHMDRTPFQERHMDAARNDRGSYFKSNGGRPSRMAAERPMTEGRRDQSPGARNDARPMQRNDGRPGPGNDSRSMQRNDARPTQRNDMRPTQGNDGRSMQRNDARPAQRNDMRPTQGNDNRPMQRNDARPTQRNDGRPDQRNDARPAQRNDARPAQRNDARPASRPAPESRPAPQSRPENKDEHKH
jgi:hypothetical protein